MLCEKYGEKRSFRRNDEFLRAGENCTEIGLVTEGYFRYEVCAASGERRITGFAFVNEYVTDFYKATCGSECITSIVAGRASSAMVVPAARLMELACRDEDFIQRVIKVLYEILYERYIDLYRYTPAERYERLARQYPKLLQLLPLCEIASFLQVTLVHLSRIRRKMLRGGDGWQEL